MPASGKIGLAMIADTGGQPMKPSIKNAMSGKKMRVATVFSGAAACAVAFTPAAMAGTGQPAVTHLAGPLRQGITPDTETGCNSHVCVGLYGGGSYVSSVNAHWFGGTGCHLAHINVYSPLGAIEPFYGSNPKTYYCSKAEITKIYDTHFLPGTQFCIYFNNVGAQNAECEPVR
jgi:hypothetical protein